MHDECRGTAQRTDGWLLHLLILDNFASWCTTFVNDLQRIPFVDDGVYIVNTIICWWCWWYYCSCCYLFAFYCDKKKILEEVATTNNAKTNNLYSPPPDATNNIKLFQYGAVYNSVSIYRCRSARSTEEDDGCVDRAAYVTATAFLLKPNNVDCRRDRRL